MKKFFCLMLTVAILITSFITATSEVIAAEWIPQWKTRAISIGFDKWCGNEFKSDRELHAYKFTVPTAGTITIRFESKNPVFTRIEDYYSECTCLVVSTKKINSYDYCSIDPASEYSSCTYAKALKHIYGFSSKTKYHWGEYKVQISSGSYYLLINPYEPSNWSANKRSYDLKISYSPSFAKASIKEVAAKDNAFAVYWPFASDASGYQIQYSLKPDMSSAKTVKISSKYTTSKLVKNLKHKKKYYVRMRKYTTLKANGSTKTYYSNWSAKKGVTTK